MAKKRSSTRGARASSRSRGSAASKSRDGSGSSSKKSRSLNPAELKTAALLALSIEEAAERFGMDEAALRRRIAHDAALHAAWNEGLAELRECVHKDLVQASHDGKVSAMQELLRRLDGNRLEPEEEDTGRREERKSLHDRVSENLERRLAE